ncbi:MAG: PC4/YdbC family ssDNA-binding protein [Termitinemataceae bacterium]
MPDIVFEITKHFGVLSEEKSGWKKEVNLVSWNNRTPKLDIRDWSPDHEKMGKGITLTKEEATKLVELLNGALNQL